jgi:uncharacterized membrane protein
MNKKQYKSCRIAIVIALSLAISVSISVQNYYLPILFVLTAMAGMYYCRKQLVTEEVMADERDYKVAGDAARYTITIYGTLGAVSMFVMMGISQGEGLLYDLSQFVAYSVCFIMLLNAFMFKYLSKKGK